MKLTAHASIEPNDRDGWTVWTDWTCDDPTVRIDRPRTNGISTGKNRKLAERLAAAIDAQAVWQLPANRPRMIATDNYGKTFVASRSRVMGRYLNSDLRKLGF